ncbi:MULTISPECIES: helix-turn-helix domain-containing protein [Bacillus]|uniref:helix-turn-helix domain-containing protein n=1 Tax=Bacillus TaxID=1386 RepID=UPI0012FF4AD2|nr:MULTISPECIES: helix-turn-helix domain-containing protein [Bacillus]
MTELGNKLKVAREAKSLSLEDLQSITKIQKRYLIGIEEGDYSKMPGAFYARAFIKQYAEAVGLDPDILFEEHKSDIPTNSKSELPDQLSRVKTRRQVPSEDSKIIQLLPKVLGVLVIIALFVLIWLLFLSKTGENPNTQQNNNEAPLDYEAPAIVDEETNEPEEPVEEEPIEEEPEPSTGTLQLISQSGTNATFELTGTDVFTVEMSSTGGPWIGVENNAGQKFFFDTLPNGETETFDFSNEREVIFNIGNTIDTILVINGETFEYPLDPQASVRQGITIIFTPASEE